MKLSALIVALRVIQFSKTSYRSALPLLSQGTMASADF